MARSCWIGTLSCLPSLLINQGDKALQVLTSPSTAPKLHPSSPSFHAISPLPFCLSSVSLLLLSIPFLSSFSPPQPPPSMWKFMFTLCQHGFLCLCLCPPPCPELLKGDKCIDNKGRGPAATAGSSPSGQRDTNGGKKAKRSLLVQLRGNTFVDKLKATLPLPVTLGRFVGRGWRRGMGGGGRGRGSKNSLAPLGGECPSFPIPSGKASHATASPPSCPVPGGFCLGETQRGSCRGTGTRHGCPVPLQQHLASLRCPFWCQSHPRVHPPPSC